MASNYKVVEIPLVQGIDQSAATQLAPQGPLADVDGMRFDEDGSLRPRYPLASLAQTVPGGGSFTAYQLGLRGDQLMALGDEESSGYPTRVYEFIDTGGLAWSRESADFNNAPMFNGIKRLGAPGVGGEAVGICCAAVGDFACVVWQDRPTTGTSSCNMTLWSIGTGQILVTEKLSISGATDFIEPKVQVAGSSFHVFARKVTNDQIALWTIDPFTDTALTNVSSNINSTTLSPSTGYSVAYHVGTARWAVLQTAASGQRLEVHNSTFTSLVGSSSSATATSSPDLVAHGSNFYSVWYNTGIVRVQATRYGLTGSVVTGPTTVSSEAGDTGVYQCGLTATSNSLVMVFSKASNMGIEVKAVNPTAFGTVYMNAFYPNMAMVQAPVGTENSYPNFEVVVPVVVHNKQPANEHSFGLLAVDGLGRGFLEAELAVYSTAAVDPGSTTGIGKSAMYQAVSPRVGDVEAWFVFGGQFLNDRDGVAVDVITATRGGFRNLVSVDGGTFVAGGSPAMWDGAAAYEVGWHSRPVIEVFNTATTGALTLLGTYNYFGTWAAIDRFGRDHLSAPSTLLTYTLTGSEDLVNVAFQGALTMRGRSVSSPKGKMDLYRTEDGAQTPYFDASRNFIYQTTGPVDQAVTSQQSDEDLAGIDTGLDRDSDAAGLRVLYIRNTQVEVAAPLPGDLAAVSAGRVFVCSTGTRRIQASKPLVSGEPLQFTGAGSLGHFNFFIECPEEVYALAALDDTLYVFGRRRVFVTNAATGPDTNGNGEFAPLTQLPSVGGVLNPRSVVEVNEGLVCDVSGRLSLLPRGFGSPQWIGEPVREAFEGRTVTAACAREEGYEAVFFLDDGSSLAYDFRNKQWTQGVHGALVNPVVSAVEFEGRLVVIDDTGALFREATDYSGASATTTTLETHSLNFAGVLGWASVKKVGLLASYLGGGTVEARISYNDGVTWSTLGTRTVATGGTEGNPVELFWSPRVTKKTRFRLQFLVTSAATTGGLKCHAFRFEGVAMSGRLRGGTQSNG